MKSIPREAWRQEGLIRFADAAIAVPKVVLGFDRAAPRGKMSHLYQARRGVRAGCSDTGTFTECAVLWWEVKAGSNKPDANQLQFRDHIRDVGHYWGWGTTISDYLRDLRLCGIPVVQNADLLAAHFDAFVEGRIAKAEGAAPKRPGRPKRTPRYTANKRMAAKIYSGSAA